MSARQFENLRASALFCGRCAEAMPVRERLLLVLPGRELFEYHCTVCNDVLGSREVTVMEQLIVQKAAAARQAGAPQVRLLN